MERLKTDTQETKKKVLGGNTSGNLLNLVFLAERTEAEKIVLIQLQARMPVVVERAASHAVVAHFQPVVFGGLLDADCRLDGFIDCHRKPSVHNILESTKHPP